MNLNPTLSGQSIAHYSVGERLGEGGMGTVYRARDTKLGRDVALKVLSAAFSGSAERMALLRREAQVLASLNHPHIAAIYGLEDAGVTYALAMELIEGPTLADRIARGPIPLDEALPIAHQIAEALETAHDKGFVHRDLKPANIKIAPGGIVKLLDFGLAKAYAPFPSAGGPAEAATLTLRATQEGLILGTAAYMSPEQARGAEVDKKTDIWAFGAVLFEMLTGAQAFEGETISDILAGVLKSEPEWSRLSADLPVNIRDLLRRCLQKDLKRRLHDIADARIEIEETLAAGKAGEGREGPVARPVPLWRRAMPWSLSGAMAIALAASLWIIPRSKPAPSSELIAHLSIVLPKGVVLASADRFPLGIGRPLIALSRDGRKIACVVIDGDTTKIMVRSLDAAEFATIPGTAGAHSPFFSPDGTSLGFFADERLKTVSLSGNSSMDLGPAPMGYGGYWAPDGIIFSPVPGPLMKVPAEGGASKPLVPAGSSGSSPACFWPELLPGGSALICTTSEGITLLDLGSGGVRLLVPGGSSGRFLPPGRLLYAQEGKLLSVPFDLRRLEITGPSNVVLDGIRTELPPQGRNGGVAQFAVTDNGTLVYLGGGNASLAKLVWVDRQGKEEPIDLPARDYGNFKISPDGRKVAATLFDQGRGDIWIYEPGRPPARFTAEGTIGVPFWSSDGRWIIYQRMEGKKRLLVRKPADGSANRGEIVESELGGHIIDISRDGRFAAQTRVDPSTLQDIWIQPLAPRAPAFPFINTPFFESFPAFSPDGRRLAFVSDESGRWEIYSRPIPEPGPKIQVSTAGGEEPLWSKDGREIFFRFGPKWMSASIVTEPRFSVSSPRVIFEGPYLNIGGYSYDVSPDGRRFLVLRGIQDPSPGGRIEIILKGSEFIESRTR